MSTSRSLLRAPRALSAAAIAGVVGTLALIPAADAALRVGQNYRMNSDSSAFRGKDQLGLAVNPANPQHVVATHANYHTEHCEATASFDGGVNWSEAVSLLPEVPAIGSPFVRSCRISNHLAESMAQTVEFGTGLNVYATSITPRTADFGETGQSTLVYKSTDGGVTWGPGRVAMAGGPSAPGGGQPNATTGPSYELPTIAVDPGAGTGGADRIYTAARDTTGFGNSGPPCPSASCPGSWIAVSNDGGQTWSSPVLVSAPGVATAGGQDRPSQPVIGPDHSVSTAYRVSGGTAPVHFVRSTDAGQTWSTPVTITNVDNVSRPSSSHVTPAVSSGSTFPRLAVNKTNGNLYVVYNQRPPGPTGTYNGADHFIPPDELVWFQRSLDNGATWSTPKQIGDGTPRPGTPTVQTRHPNVEVAPNGRIDIVWQDRRHWYQGPGERNCVHTHIACDDARLGDTYYAYSTNNGSTFSKDRRISDRSHNNDVGYDYRFGTGWAYGPVTAAMGSDTLLVGWMDAREGNFDNDTQDIYLAKVRHDSGAAIPQSTIDHPDPVALSVALSKHAYEGGGESILASTFATRNGTRTVIVNQDDPAAALAASVLARAYLATVLLSPATGLPASVKAEVSRLNPAGAFVIGNTTQLSDQVGADLASAGVDAGQIVRLSGAGAAGTAAAIAAQMDRRTDAEKAADVPAFDAVVIANPASPDASAAAALAAARRLPILFVDAGSVPAATQTALASLDIAKTLVVGGTGQVASAVLAGLPDATRLGGADQYETSSAVAGEATVRGMPSNVTYVVDGTRPMDAALVGAAVGRITGNMVLARAPLASNAAATATAADLSGIDRFVIVQRTAVTPPPPPPPPPPVVSPPAAPPPPAATIVRRKGKLSAKVTPSRKLRAPYRFTVSGRLTLPSGITRSAGCSGRVTVQVKRGSTTISTRRAFIKRATCTYSLRVTFNNRRRFGKATRLRFTARYGGNARVLPTTATSRHARIRR